MSPAKDSCSSSGCWRVAVATNQSIIERCRLSDSTIPAAPACTLTTTLFLSRSARTCHVATLYLPRI